MDYLGHLYRAAFFMAKDQFQNSAASLAKAKNISSTKITFLLNSLEEENTKYWAEKILDLYILHQNACRSLVCKQTIGNGLGTVRILLFSGFMQIL